MWTSTKGSYSTRRGRIYSTGRTNSIVEFRRSTATNTVFPEGLYGAHFDSLVAGEAHEVVGKIENLLARIGKFRPEPICTESYVGREIGLFLRSKRGTWVPCCPFIHELVDLLSWPV